MQTFPTRLRNPLQHTTSTTTQFESTMHTMPISMHSASSPFETPKQTLQTQSPAGCNTLANRGQSANHPVNYFARTLGIAPDIISPRCFPAISFDPPSSGTMGLKSFSGTHVGSLFGRNTNHITLPLTSWPQVSLVIMTFNAPSNISRPLLLGPRFTIFK